MTIYLIRTSPGGRRGIGHYAEASNLAALYAGDYRTFCGNAAPGDSSKWRAVESAGLPDGAWRMCRVCEYVRKKREKEGR